MVSINRSRIARQCLRSGVALRLMACLLTTLLALASATAGGGVAAQDNRAAQPRAFHLQEATIADVHAALNSRAITCRALVDLYLARIEAYNKSGPAINAVQNINPHARQEAERLDAAFLSTGPVGPLHCVPVLVKDQVETRDMPTTYGSAVFKDFIPERDATVVAKLKAAGAVIVAKSTMGEFASAYAGSAFGVSRNAYDPLRVPSGSSSGTGAGIAANLAMVGIVEDTGGSGRGPAAVHSLVALRPTVQLVSRFGMMPGNPIRDTLGPLARTVRDAALVLDAIAGYDANDPMTAYAYGQTPATYTALLTTDGLRGTRIGVIRDPMDNTTDTKSDDYRRVRVVTDEAIADLAKLGAKLVDPLPLPPRNAALNTGSAGSAGPFEAELNAYLAQHPNAPVKTLREIVLSGKVLPRRTREIMTGIGRSTSDPGYVQGLAAREQLRLLWLKIMADARLDAIVYATFDHQPTLIPEDVLTSVEVGDYRAGSNRALSPSVGFPSLTVPAGFTSDKLPVGLEFMGRPFAEATLFKLAYAYEQATHRRRPPPLTPPLPGEP